MSKFIVAVAVWLVKPSASRTSGEAGAGWLGRHNSRPLRAAPKVHEAYVDPRPRLVLFALALLCALFFLWLRKDPLWRNHTRYTLATGPVAALLLVLPGVAYYLFLAVVLLWLSATGAKLWKIPFAATTISIQELP